ncbi:hypothetical protein BDY21DRAFT_350374 [Lineolata rhizophorae]|uniref:Uncharacterized protein n=1 Tax=Lineolata rhizophorae TaxID=578093 RepID=A0A6A6NVL8_9PEZI|nr:hypothetical protein BDY21DRAFT_350374 [Lineolata rhizophorae]
MLRSGTRLPGFVPRMNNSGVVLCSCLFFFLFWRFVWLSVGLARRGLAPLTAGARTQRMVLADSAMRGHGRRALGVGCRGFRARDSFRAAPACLAC